ncbi:MAG: ABC transporter substrate-binding protein [Elusimicrobia bacterium]|nr:ABC transporter substrate-binding protein [Elusimicrobiota bacterium]
MDGHGTRRGRAALLAGLAGLAVAVRPAPAAAAPRPLRLVWRTSLPEPASRWAASEFALAHPGVVIEPVQAEGMFARWRALAVAWEDSDVVTDIGVELVPEFAESGYLAPLGPRTERSGTCPLSPPRESWAYTHGFRFPLHLGNWAQAAPEKAPRSLAALAEPRWKGEVVFPDPSSSVEAACLYKFALDSPGLGASWLARMKENRVLLVMSPEAVKTAVSYKTRRAGWGALRLAQDVRWRVPIEGSPLLLYATGVSAASAHGPQARKFMRWLLEPEVQRRMETARKSVSLAGGDCGRLARESSLCLRGLAEMSREEVRALIDKAEQALSGERR